MSNENIHGVDTTPRTYRVAERPLVVIAGWESQAGVRLTRINTKTAYFRATYFAGEMSIDVNHVLEIRE